MFGLAVASGSAIAVVLFAGLYPPLIASRLQPVDALRSERGDIMPFTNAREREATGDLATRLSAVCQGALKQHEKVARVQVKAGVGNPEALRSINVDQYDL